MVLFPYLSMTWMSTSALPTSSRVALKKNNSKVENSEQFTDGREEIEGVMTVISLHERFYMSSWVMIYFITTVHKNNKMKRV